MSFFSKGHADFFCEIWHDFDKNRIYDLLNLRYPVRPLSLPELRLTSVLANSGTPYVLFLAKFMPKKFVNFGMTLLKIGHMEIKLPNILNNNLVVYSLYYIVL